MSDASSTSSAEQVFAGAFEASPTPMVMAQASRPDNPIVWVNDAFLHHTGYEREELIGRDCRMLQGPDSDPAAIALIRDGLRAGATIEVELFNTRKDGTPFWNALYISPVVDEQGELLFYFASQVDVTDRKRSEMNALADRERIEKAVQERTRDLEMAFARQTELLHEVDHRVKNNLQLVSALIVLETKSAAGKSTKEALRTLKDRMDALSSVHKRLYREGDSSRFDVAAFVREFTADMLQIGRAQLSLDLAEAPVSAAFAAPVALISSELVRIGASTLASRPDAILHFRIAEVSEGVHRFCLSTDGPGPDLSNGTAEGTRTFIALLARQLRAEVHWPTPESNSICVDIPADELARGG